MNSNSVKFVLWLRIKFHRSIDAGEEDGKGMEKAGKEEDETGEKC